MPRNYISNKFTFDADSACAGTIFGDTGVEQEQWVKGKF